MSYYRRSFAINYQVMAILRIFQITIGRAAAYKLTVQHMKKLVSLLLTLCVLMTCGVSAMAESEQKWTGEIEEIVIPWWTAGVDNPYMDQIFEAVNDYIGDKIGVKVTIRQVSVFESASAYTRWLANNETLDLMPLPFIPTSLFTSMNMLLPIDEYLEYAPHIQALADEGIPVFDAADPEHVYGVLCISRPRVGRTGSLMIFTDVLEATGLPFKDGDTISLEDMDQIFHAVKANDPDAYLGISGTITKGNETFVYDALGASLSSGALVGIDSTEVVNAYDTDEYRAYLNMARGWYLDGIIKKDAATTDATDAGSMTNDPDHCVMAINVADFGIVQDYAGRSGRPVSMLFTTEIYQPTVMPTAGAYTTIPFTAKHPEAAMRFLDMLYYDDTLVTMIYSGLEGVTYTYTDESRTVIEKMSDVNFYTIGTYGDLSHRTDFGAQDPNKEEKIAKFEAQGMANHTKGYGFCYDASRMTNQISAIDAVISEYVAALETGSADLDKVYPEFLNKLKQNGIDAVIADKQAQFNEWLKNK